MTILPQAFDQGSSNHIVEVKWFGPGFDLMESWRSALDLGVLVPEISSGEEIYIAWICDGRDYFLPTVIDVTLQCEVKL